MEMEKTFNPQAVESEIYRDWESSGAFEAHRVEGKKPFTIVMPPPNITCLLYTSPSPRDRTRSRMPSSA